MTVTATETGMFPGQRKLCLLAVIELPERPAIGVMAAGALLAEPAFVNVLGTMTCEAFDRRIAIGTRRMAFLAGNAGVQPDERKSRKVVVEPDVVPPPGLLVARLAVAPHRAGVGVVGRMAAMAVLGHRLLLYDAGMAAVAGQFLVGTAQLEPGARRVIIGRDSPFLLAVTIGAGTTKASRMPVSGGVAASALSWERRLEVAATVTRITGQRLVPPFQRVTGRLRMIEAGLLPVHCAMAGRAVSTAGPAMNVIRGVTVDTPHRRALETWIAVAGSTRHPAMRVFERESRLVVIELRRLETGRLVAVSTGASKLPMVGIVIAMTVLAELRRVAERLPCCVTGVASGRGVGAGQWKIGPLVVEALGVEVDDIGGASLVLGVAGIALRPAGRTAVKACACGEIGRDFRMIMASDAERALAGLVGAVVAHAAVVLELHVRVGQIAGHEKPFQRAGMRGLGCESQGHQCHPPGCQPHQSPLGVQYR